MECRVSYIGSFCYGSCPRDLGIENDSEVFDSMYPWDVLVADFDDFKSLVSFGCKCDRLCFGRVDF